MNNKLTMDNLLKKITDNDMKESGYNMNSLEVKGKKNAMTVAMILIETGYSVMMPNIDEYQLNKNSDEERHYIINYSFTKYGESPFILEEE